MESDWYGTVNSKYMEVLMVSKNDNNRRNGEQVQGEQQEQKSKPEQTQERTQEHPSERSAERTQERPQYQNRNQGHYQNQNGGQRQNQVGQNPNQGQNNNQIQNKNNEQVAKAQNERPEGGRPREGGQNRGYYRDSQQRQHSSSQPSAPRYSSRNRVEETIDDIKEDIVRIEKEIEMEINEIKSLKL